MIIIIPRLQLPGPSLKFPCTALHCLLSLVPACQTQGNEGTEERKQERERAREKSMYNT